METNEKLKEMLELLLDKSTFSVGDIVEWKPQMRNKKADGPFIVQEILTEPIFDQSVDSNNYHFMEPLDIILAHFDWGYGYVAVPYDSRRFKHAVK